VNGQGIRPFPTIQGAWVTPYIVSPNDPLTLYAGYADIWKTTNRGDSWTKISSMNTSYKMRSMAIAPSNVQVLYVADIYTIWKTTDGGTSWNNITGTLPVGPSNITYITIKNDDPNTLWVTLGGYNADRVFQSVDGGTTWTNISTGLPQIPAYSLVQNIQSTGEVQLYVGTELGIYVKKGSDNWVEFNTGLPNVRIGEIEIYYNSNPHLSRLRAATFGRGLWETPFDYSDEQMAYVSGTVTQNNTANTFPGNLNQEIIGIQITTVGSLTPINATTFTLNTLGSTNAISDISKARIYYTGASNVFATSTQFGSDINFPNGTFTISGNQPLIDGTNYFWLTYDIAATATLKNYVDAQCTSLTVGTAKTPLVTNPAGNRLLDYCGATSTTCNNYIQNVLVYFWDGSVIENINNTSGCTPGGYSDYSSISVDMARGSEKSLKVTSNIGIYDFCGVWVDWNNNGDFLDDPAIITYGPGYKNYYATITCPANASPGLKRMRVRLNNGGSTSPCGNYAWGEVEDYSINVLPDPMTYVSSTTSQNNTSPVAPKLFNQEIICIQIVTSGDYSPLNISSFTFNTTGSTSPLTEIANAKLFYSGTSGSFAATSQFGTTLYSPDGTFTITGNQTLANGTNYFWLTYDLASTAIVSNVVDAQCTSVTIGSVNTPTVTSPPGNRVIVAGNFISGIFSYNNSAGTAIDSMWVHLRKNYIIIDSVMTNLSGQYYFSNVPDDIYTVSSRCTKPWSGVNATDAIKIQRHFAALELLTTPVRVLSADVNISNSINATDALKVKRRFSGLDPSFIRGNWAIAKPDGGDTIIVNGANITQDFQVLCVGDVNGSNTPSPGDNSNSTSVTITHNGLLEVRPGQEFDLPIRISSTSMVNAISLVIPYPSDMLEVLNIQTPIGSPAYTALNDNIRIAWSDLQTLNLNPGDTLISLKLRATENFTGDLTIDLEATDESELADETGNVIPIAELFTQTIKTRNLMGIEDPNSILRQCTIYPNPASNVLNIEVKVTEKTTLNMELSDMLGRVKTRKEMGELIPGISIFHISTANLLNGVYTIKLELDGENGKSTYLYKVVISK